MASSRDQANNVAHGAKMDDDRRPTSVPTASRYPPSSLAVGRQFAYQHLFQFLTRHRNADRNVFAECDVALWRSRWLEYSKTHHVIKFNSQLLQELVFRGSDPRAWNVLPPAALSLSGVKR